MENNRQSAQAVVGYVAAQSQKQGSFGIIDRFARVVPLLVRSVVTDKAELPLASPVEIKQGEQLFITAAQRRKSFVPKIESGDPSFEFDLRAVRALGVLNTNGSLSLIDTELLDDRNELPRNAVLVDLVSVQSTYHLTCFDETTQARYDLGFLAGDTSPSKEFIVRINQSNYPEFSDFTSWKDVALLRREQYLAEKAKEVEEDEYEKDPTKGYREAHEEAEERYRQRQKAAEPVEDIVISFADVELFRRALNLVGAGVTGLNYEIREDGYHIGRTDVALAALQKARAEQKREDELEAPKEPEPVVQSASERVVLRHERSES